MAQLSVSSAVRRFLARPSPRAVLEILETQFAPVGLVNGQCKRKFRYTGKQTPGQITQKVQSKLADV